MAGAAARFVLAAAEGKENIDSLKGEKMAVWTGEGVLEMDIHTFVQAAENMGEKYQDETDKYLDFDELLRIRGKKN